MSEEPWNSDLVNGDHRYILSIQREVFGTKVLVVCQLEPRSFFHGGHFSLDRPRSAN